MFRRWLCLILALALCSAQLAAAAEMDAVSEGVDAEASYAVFAGDTGLTVEMDAAAQPTEGDLPQPEEAAAPEPEQAPADDEPAEAGGPATGIKLSASKLSMGLKETYSGLAATLAPAGATNAVTWSTSNKKVVTVNALTGALTGVKTGTATITATTDNGHAAKCKVTVKGAPKSVALGDATLTLSVGQTYALVATPSKDSASALMTYKSSKKSVAKVNADGVITAAKAGSAKITVTTYNGKKAACNVKVLRAPRQVSLPKTLTISEGERKTVAATSLDKKGKDTVATYTYSAEAGTGSVTVDASTGEVKGVKAGTAFIRVSTHNGVTTHLDGGAAVETVCAVTVKKGPAKVTLAATSATIGVGQSFALSPVILDSDGAEMGKAKYTVASSNAKKLSVTDKGVVKGLATGSYTVTVTAFNGVSAKCAVKVVNAPSKVTLSPAAPVIGQGQTSKLTAKFPKGSTASVTWSTSDAGVVAVDKQGNITGLKTGTAVVTVKTHNSKKAKVTVTVTRGPAFMALNADYELVYDELACAYTVLYAKTLSKGKTFQITYENEYLTSGNVVAFESLNPSVATVSEGGLVTAVSSGTAIIVARSSSGAEARLKVTVPGQPAPSIAFAVGGVTLKAGQSAEAPALTGENITAKKLAAATYTSGDAGVFTVAWDEAEARWMLRGVAPGTAALTAAADGATARIQVEVVEAEAVTGIAFESATTTMTVGETYAPVVVDSAGNAVKAELYTDNTGVASADDMGVITAVGEGSATVTAVCGAFSAAMTVRVNAAPPQVTLNAASLTLGAGQRFTLAVEVDGAGTLANVAFASSNAAVASVNRKGVIAARAAGIAQITVTAAGGAQAACQVRVMPAPTAISVEPATITARVGDAGRQLSWSFGASDELSDVTFSTADKRVAEVDAAGFVTFKGSGETTVTVRTGNGLKASVVVTVLPEKQAGATPSYRLFAAYSFFDTSYNGYLPFTKNNAKSMTSVFGKSSIDGATYKMKLMGNPSKTQLLSGIASFFKDAGDNDVSVVFLCSHGQMDSDYRNYRMQLPGISEYPGNANYYITSREIMNCVQRIQGRVVLIIDSCYSGAFLQDMRGTLDALGGRIAVLTAASDTRATYYNVKTTSKAVDFYTYFLLQGLGYNEKEGYWNANASGGKGGYPGYLAADSMGNGDGKVTLGELYTYTSMCIAVNIPTYMKKSWYWGDKTRVQQPRYYAGALDSLVVYQPST